MQCELCQPHPHPLYQDGKLRVILVDDADYPGFCRVIWHDHVKEMSDLNDQDCAHLLNWVMRTERAVRAVLQPDKINLASFGNVVPHLHWHVIARFDWDTHFPAPIWAPAQRAADVARLAALQEALPALDQAVLAALAHWPD